MCHEGHRNKPEESPASQTWQHLSKIMTVMDYNPLKKIIHEFICRKNREEEALDFSIKNKTKSP